MISRRDTLKLGALGLASPVVLTACGSGDKAPSVPTATPEPTEIPLAAGVSLGGTPIANAVAYEDDGYSTTFHGDPARTGTAPGPGLRWDHPVIVKWKYLLPTSEKGNAADPSSLEVSGDGAEPPLVVLGVVYTAIRRDVVALDGSTGEEVWRFPTNDTIYCAPAIADNILFVGSNDENLYAIDSTTGAGIWKSPLGDAIHGSPAIVDNRIYVTTVGARTDMGLLYCLDAQTGNEHWRFQLDGLCYAAPAVADGTVFAVGTGGTVYAVDVLTGAKRWEFPAGGNGKLAPAVSNGLVYVGGSDSFLHALDQETGNEIWRFQMGDKLRSEPTIDAGIVYFGSSDANNYAVAADTGRELWRQATDLFYTNYSISVVDGVAYQGMRAFRADTGYPIDGYRYSGVTEISSRPRYAQVVVGGSVCVVTSEYIFLIGNLLPTLISQNTPLRGAPSASGIPLGEASVGSVVSSIRTKEERDGASWVEVTVNGVAGWIPLHAIDQATLPPEGEIEYLYVP